MNQNMRDQIFALRQSKSAQQIASMFGLTRNQVIGIWYRERIKRGEKPLHRPRFNHPVRQAPRQATVFKRVKTIAVEPLPAPVVPPETTPVSFADLEPDQCHYPVTHDSPHLFCGAPKADGSSYCAFHDRVCWRHREAPPPSWARSLRDQCTAADDLAIREMPRGC